MVDRNMARGGVTRRTLLRSGMLGGLGLASAALLGCRSNGGTSTGTSGGGSGMCIQVYVRACAHACVRMVKEGGAGSEY